MTDPLFYILAPFGLAFGLFAVYLIVSVIMGDPGRPFRMFAARPLPDTRHEANRIMDRLESGEPDERETAELADRLRQILESGEGDAWRAVRHRAEQWVRHDRPAP